MSSVPLSKAKAHLTRLIAEAEELGEEIVITRSGRPAGVLVGYDEYQGLLEMLEILADPELTEAVRKGLEEAEAGKVVSHEDAWSDLDDPLLG